jgi:hypothetical protein
MLNPSKRDRENITGKQRKYENLKLVPKEHGRWILWDTTGDGTKFTTEMKAWQLDEFWIAHRTVEQSI